MSTIDNYGEFEMPEEKTVIEVVEDPVKTVMSCYEIYKKLLEKMIDNDANRFGYYYREKSYSAATKSLEAKEKLKPTPEQIKKIIEKLGKKNEQGVGAFLSALHNQTSIETLVLDDISFLIKNSTIGHYLKNDKKLIIGQRCMTEDVGIDGEGKIINYGNLRYVYSNKSTSQIINVINFGSIGSLYAGKELININQNQVKDLWIDNENWIINTKSSARLMEGDHYGIYCVGELPPKSIFHQTEILKFEILKFSKKLEDKLKELSFLENLPTLTYEEQYKQVDAFDFKKFEKEVKKIVEEIYEEGRK